MRSDLIDITVMIERETEKAWGLNNGTGPMIWVPKSMSEVDDRKPNGLATMTLPERFAIEKGLG